MIGEGKDVVEEKKNVQVQMFIMEMKIDDEERRGEKDNKIGREERKDTTKRKEEERRREASRIVPTERTE